MLIIINMFDVTAESLLTNIATDNLNCYVCDKRFEFRSCEKLGDPFV